MAVKPIPDGFHTVTPYLMVNGATQLLEFIQKAFDAEVFECHKTPSGSIMHAQVKIGDSIIMLSDSLVMPPMPGQLYLYVGDVDAAYKRAMKAGGTSIMEPADQFYGDRNAGVKDPVGNQWWFATHIEDVSPQEMEKRTAQHRK